MSAAGETREAVVVRGADELRALVDRELGPSARRVLDQAMVDAFATLSGDRNWIHVDPARAARESPWGTTIVHGDLLVAVSGGLRGELLRLEGFEMALNRGWRSVELEGHVSTGEAVEATVTPVALTPVTGDWLELTERVTLRTQGRSVLTGESVTWLLPDP